MSRAIGLTFLLAILFAAMFMLGACAGGDEHTESALSEEPVCDVNVTTKVCESFLYAAPIKGE